jgi:type I restriction enzyme, S subunit
MSSEFIDTEYGKISRELNKAKLEDICVPENGVQTGPFGSLLHKKDYVDSGTPIITVEHLDDNRISHIETPFVSDEDKERLSKYVMHEGDIVFSRVGSVDRRALVRESEDGWLFSGRCLRVRVNQEVIDPVYLSHFFGMENFKAYVRSIAVGATMPSLNTKLLSDLPIYYPEYEKQLEIADILETLDQKIHLNRQTNDTLEAMAQAIFRSWFVDFDPVHTKIEARSAGRDPNRAAMAAIAGISLEQEWDEIEAALDQKLARMTEEQRQQLTRTAQLFPDELEESEIGEVPKGWGIKPFYDTIEIIGGGTPKTKIDEYWDGDILWYSVVDAPSENDIFVIDTEKKITKTGLDNSSAKLVDTGTTIISARGTVGKLALTPKPMTYNQSCYGLRSKNDCPSFNFYKTKQLVESLKRGSHGSVFDTITQKTFKTIDIVQPPENLEKRFDDSVDGIMSMIQKNLEESSTLNQLRDTLLPKLISGELRLKNNNKIYSI